MDHDAHAVDLSRTHLVGQHAPTSDTVFLVGSITTLFQLLELPAGEWADFVVAESAYLRRSRLPLADRVSSLLELLPDEGSGTIPLALGPEEHTDEFVEILKSAARDPARSEPELYALKQVVDAIESRRTTEPAIDLNDWRSKFDDMWGMYRDLQPQVLEVQAKSFGQLTTPDAELPPIASYPQWDAARLARPISDPALAPYVNEAYRAIRSDNRDQMLQIGTVLLDNLRAPGAISQWVKCPELALAFTAMGRRALLEGDLLLAEQHLLRAKEILSDANVIELGSISALNDLAHIDEWLMYGLTSADPLRAVSYGYQAIATWEQLERVDGVIGCAIHAANILFNLGAVQEAYSLLMERCGRHLDRVPDAAFANVLNLIASIRALHEVEAIEAANHPSLRISVHDNSDGPQPLATGSDLVNSASAGDAVDSDVDRPAANAAGDPSSNESKRLPDVMLPVHVVSPDRDEPIELGVIRSPAVTYFVTALGIAERSETTEVAVTVARNFSLWLRRAGAPTMAAWLEDRFLSEALAAVATPKPPNVMFLFERLDEMLSALPSRRRSEIASLASQLFMHARRHGVEVPDIPGNLIAALLDAFADDADWVHALDVVRGLLLGAESVISASVGEVTEVALDFTILERQQQRLFPVVSVAARALFTRTEGIPPDLRETLINWLIAARYRNPHRRSGVSRPFVLADVVQSLGPREAFLLYVPFEERAGDRSDRHIGVVLVSSSGAMEFGELDLDRVTALAKVVRSIDSSGDSSDAFNVGAMLPASLAESIHRADVRSVLVSPVAEVCWLPAGALLNGHGYGDRPISVGCLLSNEVQELRTGTISRSSARLVHAGLTSLEGRPLGLPVEVANRVEIIDEMVSVSDAFAVLSACEVFNYFGHVTYEQGPESATVALGDGAARVADLFDALATGPGPTLVMFWGCGSAAVDTWTRWSVRELLGPAAQAISAGTSAFVGPLWEQSAGVLNELGTYISNRILHGEPIGLAVEHSARLYRAMHPEASWRDWGCIGVFGNPNWRLM